MGRDHPREPRRDDGLGQPERQQQPGADRDMASAAIRPGAGRRCASLRRQRAGAGLCDIPVGHRRRHRMARLCAPAEPGGGPVLPARGAGSDRRFPLGLRFPAGQRAALVRRRSDPFGPTFASQLVGGPANSWVRGGRNFCRASLTRLRRPRSRGGAFHSRRSAGARGPDRCDDLGHQEHDATKGTHAIAATARPVSQT